MLSPIKELVTADEDNSNPTDALERSIIINESQPLARYSVLYLGTAIPSSDQRGIDSVQEPLSKRYPVGESEVVQGIEAWITIDENGLQIQFASDPSVVLYYPIRSLVYCASVRFATRTDTGEAFPNGWRFVPLDSPDAAQTENAQNPPLFAVTFHRTRHLPIDECHCFIAKTKQIALALVQACSNAYHSTDSEQDCSKVPLYFKILNEGLQMKEIDDDISLVPAVEDESTTDYQIDNKAAGFFYKTDLVRIDCWKLWENPKHTLRRSSSAQSISSHSSRSTRHRRLPSIISIPETDKPPTPPPMVDPFAPDPNVLRVERIKDDRTGRDVFVRWLKSPLEEIRTPPIPIYDFQINSNADNNRSQREVQNGIQRLVLEDKAPPLPEEPRRSKKKKKHRSHHHHHHHHKHSKSHRYEYIEYPPIQPAFQMPQFETRFFDIPSPAPLNSTPYWFFSM